jgi:hypothetical protein
MRLLLSSLLIFALAACSAEAPAPLPEPETPFPGAEAQHVVRGVVRLRGRLPELERAGVASRQILERIGGERPILEASVTGPGGTLPHVFVEVLGAGARWRFEPPTQPLTLRIAEFRFVPHVAGIRLGQDIQLVNEQEIEHNAHLITRYSVGFNRRLAKGAPLLLPAPLRRPERAFVKSDIYPWMRTWLFARAHPLFAVTDAEGRFALPALPVGKYRLRFTHERHGSKELDVELPLAAAEELVVDFGLL